MDPLSLLCRLATSVPLPRFHTIHYAGVLAAASVLGSLPILFLFYGFQQYFVSGYTAGAVKE